MADGDEDASPIVTVMVTFAIRKLAIAFVHLVLWVQDAKLVSSFKNLKDLSQKTDTFQALLKYL